MIPYLRNPATYGEMKAKRRVSKNWKPCAPYFNTPELRSQLKQPAPPQKQHPKTEEKQVRAQDAKESRL